MIFTMKIIVLNTLNLKSPIAFMRGMYFRKKISFLKKCKAKINDFLSKMSPINRSNQIPKEETDKLLKQKDIEVN